MHVRVPLEALKDALNVAKPAIAPKTVLPIINHYHLVADDGVLTVRATNLVTTIIVAIDADVLAEGEIAIASDQLREFVATLVGETAELKVDRRSHRTRVSCGTNTAQVVGLDAEDFPALPVDHDGQREVSIMMETLSIAARVVTVAVATTTHAPILEGVGFTAKAGCLVLGSADGFRMAAHTSAIAEDLEFAVVVPATALRALEPLLDRDSDDMISLWIDPEGHRVRATIGRATWMATTIPGVFPDVAQLLPKTAESEADIAVDELTRAIRRARVFSRAAADKFPTMRIDFVPGDDLAPATVEIVAAAESTGDVKSDMPATMSGPGGYIRLNIDYVNDIAKMLGSGSRLRVRHNGPDHPLMVTSTAIPGLSYLMMPVIEAKDRPRAVAS